jgi:hypothetical protein
MIRAFEDRDQDAVRRAAETTGRGAAGGRWVTEYEYTFVVGGIDVDDIDVVDSLYAELEASLSLAGGVPLLSIAAEGFGAVDAAIKAARSIERVVPGLRVVRMDRDLVGVPEIAERAEVTRQAVHQWIDGARHADLPPFPATEGVVGRQQVWLWSDVNDWLAQLGKDDRLIHPSRAKMAEIDAALGAGIAHLAAPALQQWLELTGARPAVTTMSNNLSRTLLTDDLTFVSVLTTQQPSGWATCTARLRRSLGAEVPIAVTTVPAFGSVSFTPSGHVAAGTASTEPQRAKTTPTGMPTSPAPFPRSL